MGKSPKMRIRELISLGIKHKRQNLYAQSKNGKYGL